MEKAMMLLRRLDESPLSSEEIESIVETAITALNGPVAGSELTRAIEKCTWIDLLAKVAGHSDRAVARLVDALADIEGYDTGSSPYDSHWQTVYDRALIALYPTEVRARALPFLLELLERTESSEGRMNAARVLGWIGPTAKAAVPLLRRFATDAHVELRAAVSSALASIEARE